MGVGAVKGMGVERVGGLRPWYGDGERNLGIFPGSVGSEMGGWVGGWMDGWMDGEESLGGWLGGGCDNSAEVETGE